MRYFPTEDQYYEWRKFWNSPEGVLLEAFLRERIPVIDRSEHAHLLGYSAGIHYGWGDLMDELTRLLSDEGKLEALGKAKEE